MTATAPGVIPYPRPGTVHCCWLSSSAPPYMVAMPCSIMEIGSGNGQKPAPTSIARSPCSTSEPPAAMAASIPLLAP
jgi:hypothetical protein